MRVAGPGLTLVLVGALGACGGGGGEDAPDAAPGSPDARPPAPDADPDELAELVIGSAPVDGVGFTDVVDGDEVELVGGAQGGFHIWTGGRVRGVTGEYRIVRSARRVADDALILADSPYAIEVPASALDDWWQVEYAMPSFMCPAPLGIQLYDEAIVLRASLVDASDRVRASDAMTVVPRCPTGDLAAFCLDICGG